MSNQQSSGAPVTVYYSYAHKDETLRNELEKHLSLLRRQGLITEWYDRRIEPGANWEQIIDEYLNNASIILLLISPDFFASDYRYEIEMRRALERHITDEARVIPIILRPCDWKQAPFRHLQCLPRDGRAVTQWPNRDAAFRDVVEDIRQVITQRTTFAPPISEQGSNSASPSSTTKEITALTYRSHTDFVFSVAWSSDGKYIASAGADGVVRVWDATTLETVRTYTMHVGWFYPNVRLRPYIYTIAWSPTESQIASAGTGNMLHIWDAFTDFKHIYSHPEPFFHFPSVRALAWSPDGRRIASICSSDGANFRQKIVHIWDVKGGQELLSYAMPTGLSLRTGLLSAALANASPLAWSPDGRYIASSCGDVAIHIWEASTGRQITTWRVRSGLVLAVAWSSDSERLAAASAAGPKSAVSLWSMHRKELILTYHGHTSDVRAVAWSPDGKCIASGGHDKVVRIWDAATGGTLDTRSHHASWITTVAWSPDGTRIASGSEDRTIHVWRAE
jgi:WD40 repeat protein